MSRKHTRTASEEFMRERKASSRTVIIGLIAAIRRVLVLTAEFGEVRGNDSVLKYFVIEIAALTVLLLVLVGSLVLLRRLAAPVVAERTPSSERQSR